MSTAFDSSAPHASDSDSHSDSGVATLPTVRVPVAKQLPGWSVLLHNDDENDFHFVIRAVVELVRLPVQDAMDRTIEAHESGVALLTVTHRERAELLQEQLVSRGLTATIEPAP